ncbi:protein archease-like isoform X2 [Pomacea canaliculata]|uniref:protein archease-like isoform X2 n=1 Tax=Pomacea canaliculata TaxID=400727 RepID=UPI000D7365EC|nr:protein archease-like isoform X2 [Pomacea canaliculata]
MVSEHKKARLHRPPCFNNRVAREIIHASTSARTRTMDDDWPSDDAFWLEEGNRLPETKLQTETEVRNEACIQSEKKQKELWEPENVELQEDNVDAAEEEEEACTFGDPEMELTNIPEIPVAKYEYLDHTADVQLHSFGADLKESFEQVAIAMFAYMTTDISKVEMKSRHEIYAEGDDLESLLYHFLDELLFLFSVEPFIICRVVRILEFDDVNFKIHAEGFGEPFDRSKHPPGTEVKAITYSNMQIHKDSETHDIFVIIDI